MKATIYNFRQWEVIIEWETKDELYANIFDYISTLWIDITFEENN